MLTETGKELLDYLKKSNQRIKVTKIVVTQLNLASDDPECDHETVIDVSDKQIVAKAKFSNLMNLIPSMLIHKVYAYDPRIDQDVHISNIAPHTKSCEATFEYFFNSDVS